MKRSGTAATVVAALMVFSTLVVVPAGTAEHNSVGGSFYVTQADEVDDGTLQADVGEDLLPVYHDNLDPARTAPPDQTGDRYTDCTKAGDVSAETYRAGLDGGDSCYVGFLDYQKEYLLAFHLLLVKQPDDALYPVNPAPDDEFCQEPTNRPSPECAGAGHNQFIPGSVAVDTDLLETGTAVAAEATTPEEGSGYLSLPLVMTPYVFLFGQPHPDNDNPSEFEAGSGPFGPDPAEGGGPLFDLSNACGDRTQECKLLTPTDIKLYDENSENLPGDLVTDDSQARVCAFSPQFAILNPDQRDAGLCGVFGNVVNQFLGTTSKGGLGIPGAPGTWQNTVPGWYQGVLTVSSPGDAALTVRAADEYQCAVDDPAALFLSSTDCDGENSRVENGLQYITAVNPKVPTEDHPLWCVRPNILATGDNSVHNLDDPGVYGSYQADAVDTDVYRRALQDQHEQVMDDNHQAVRDALAPVEAGVEGGQGLAEDAISGSPLPEDVQQALLEASDRAQYVESQDAPALKEPFQVDRDPGIACDAQGIVAAQTTSETLDGDLVVDTQLSRTGDISFSVIGLTFTEITQDTAIKDPTLLDENLPAKESETDRGAWAPRQYSFGGTVTAFIDTSEDAVHGDSEADFSGCATASGQPQPNADLCAWEPLWDAYNPECTDIDGEATCGEILESRDYDLEEGVGLYFSLKVTGPVAVTDEDMTANTPPRPNEITSRTAVLGTEDPTAQNCVVGFSMGFTDVLGDETVDQIVADACEGAGGEQHVIEDAFDDQSVSGSPGQYSVAVDFAKLLPTPSAVRDGTGLGGGDEVCVTGVWNVDEGATAEDTLGLGGFELTGAGSPPSWTDCFDFESSA